jgi:hypothetical protein
MDPLNYSSSALIDAWRDDAQKIAVTITFEYKTDAIAPFSHRILGWGPASVRTFSPDLKPKSYCR